MNFHFCNAIIFSFFLLNFDSYHHWTRPKPYKNHFLQLK